VPCQHLPVCNNGYALKALPLVTLYRVRGRHSSRCESASSSAREGPGKRIRSEVHGCKPWKDTVMCARVSFYIKCICVRTKRYLLEVAAGSPATTTILPAVALAALALALAPATAMMCRIIKAPIDGPSARPWGCTGQ
jgi:hypothetical protein